MGDYATTSAMETFTEAKGDRHPTDVAMLRGARLVTASETEEGKYWAESRIKQLTGGDKVSARFMRQDYFQFLPMFKLLIIGNHQPVLRNVDDAAKRRFNIIPFVYQPEVVDRELGEKLKSEYSAILRWMIEGCLDWQENGLVRPEVVDRSTQAYFEDQDFFGQWISEKCEVGSSYEDTTSALFASCPPCPLGVGQEVSGDVLMSFFSLFQRKPETRAAEDPSWDGVRGLSGLNTTPGGALMAELRKTAVLSSRSKFSGDVVLLDPLGTSGKPLGV